MKTLTPEQERVNRWMLKRKVEAGTITALGLNELESAEHSCKIVAQVVETLTKITEDIAKAVNLPQISDALNKISNDEKVDKSTLKLLKNESQVAERAWSDLKTVTLGIQEARLKLQSTGWLSDRPPVINEAELQKLKNEVEELEEPNASTLEQEVPTSQSLTIEKAPEKIESEADTHAPSVNELKDQLSKLKVRKKKMRGKMNKRMRSENTNDEVKAKQLREDEAKITEIDAMIGEIVADMNQLNALQEMAAQPQPVMTKMEAVDLYRKATLRSELISEQ